MRGLQRAVIAVRTDRAAQKVQPRTPATLHVRGHQGDDEPGLLAFLTDATTRPLLWSLSGVSEATSEPVPPGGANDHPHEGLVLTPVFARAEKRVDRGRVEAELAEVEAALERARARLESPAFLAKAPEKVVDGARRSVEELAAKRESLARALETAEAG
jgi:valyl-tRNA synthetase